MRIKLVRIVISRTERDNAIYANEPVHLPRKFSTSSTSKARFRSNLRIMLAVIAKELNERVRVFSSARTNV